MRAWVIDLFSLIQDPCRVSVRNMCYYYLFIFIYRDRSWNVAIYWLPRVKKKKQFSLCYKSLNSLEVFRNWKRINLLLTQILCQDGEPIHLHLHNVPEIKILQGLRVQENLIKTLSNSDSIFILIKMYWLSWINLLVYRELSRKFREHCQPCAE